ncbi:MAG TPA: hypothetical protein VFW44_21605 [Bryobacteraceae bacterium]|nr:hypothetical protein [Bryobacteraceae bacterium]
MPTKKQKPIDIVTGVLEDYAERAVFRGFSAHPGRGGKAVYRMLWHYDRPFELRLDSTQKTLLFPAILPGVPMRSPMYRELRAFMKARQSGELPEHRSVNRAKARLALANQKASVSLALTVKDSDFEYAARKIIQIVHEIFLIFLVDGPYYEYMVERLGLDPDRF